ncbi:type II secretion system protein GspD [Adhaeretor mobilis]|uniref:Type IV pilus biogenesis and competence protein PilQ n=1 Tax=Adhaeretor mobilis TaxID=1930276 RepID=A0A517MVQ2_9BACT|nr:hypothetical protein [Adhaeretor mobilis]QDS98951.1 Type IV pilus biogenesis and competence protein PilQ precursor [Adhaeretor mobilis]
MGRNVSHALLQQSHYRGRRSVIATTVLCCLLALQIVVANPLAAQESLEKPLSLQELQHQAADSLRHIQSEALRDSTAPTRRSLPPQSASARQSIGQGSLPQRANPLKANPLTTEPLPQAVVVPLQPAPAADKIAIHEAEGNISLMVRDGSLRQVVSMIAETQRLNLVFAGSVDVQITATFDRVPWQQVMDAILNASGHTSTFANNVIFVSSVDSADFIPPGAGGRVVHVFELDFAAAVDIDQGVAGLLSQAGKSWVLESSSVDNRRTREAVVVVDYPAYLERIQDFICQSDQPPRQVMIETHILQVELSDTCRNGVNFEDLIGLGSGNLSLRSTGFANAAASPSFFIESTGKALTGLVELLKTTTDAKTLASPRINAINGQESRIQIGEQLGFKVTTTTQTSTLESIQFLDVGVVLRVTPRITRDGRVLMRIKPEVSTGNVDPVSGLPSEETTEVETDVMLADGQGLVIGGLIQEKDSNIQNKVPLLGDIPYLGVLFQRRVVERSRSEIIVTLVPRILPYDAIRQERNDFDLQRTLDPLTQGAIYSAPRPYEPKMGDPLSNPYRPFLARRCSAEQCVTHGTEELQPLPAVERAYETLPPEIELAYPTDHIPLNLPQE